MTGCGGKSPNCAPGSRCTVDCELMSAADYRWMARALTLARRGLYSVDPNPRVGCVLVREGAIVGEGWHERAGEAHAEVIALAAAGRQARGATVYVTLEPCCHYGRTPPCTEALLQAGVARVAAAMRDPNPQVAGQGLAILREAGVAVDCGLLEAEARALNPGFIQRMTQGRPFVRLKLAMSLDGRTALASGESQWLTGEAARQDVQRLRARSSVILTGIGTVLADDPGLNVRLPEVSRQPLRVILDSDLRTPPTARTLQLPGSVLIFTAVADLIGKRPCSRRARTSSLSGEPDKAWICRRSWRNWPAGKAMRCMSNAARRWPAHGCKPGWWMSCLFTWLRCCSAIGRGDCSSCRH